MSIQWTFKLNRSTTIETLMTIMDYNQGKVVFSTKDEAERVAKRMSQKYSEAFSAYKIAAGWAVGGVFFKKPKKLKVKTLDEIKDLWKILRENEEDLSIEEYADSVEEKENANEISTTFGADSVWILTDYSMKTAEELGFKTRGNYLVLTITNGLETKHPKMGGAFERHIPLVTKVAESLRNKAVIWSTWNPSYNPSKWGSNSWFYKLEEDESISTSEDA
jgi:hypothetical protein